MADVLLSERLRSFVRDVGPKAWGWGELDCFLFVADWIERATGVDPAGAYRGAYEDERSARRLLVANGGPLAFAAKLLATAGCAATPAPQPGDVGLVRAHVRMGRRAIGLPTAGICLAPTRWVVKTACRSIACADFPVLAAWSVPCA